MALAATGVPASGAAADGSAPQVTASVDAGQQDLVLDLPDGSDHAVIDERGNTVLWRGRGDTRLPLQHGTMARLTVVSLSSSGATPVASVLATNPKPQAQLTPLTAVTTSENTTVDWGAIAGATSYKVLEGKARSARPLTDISETTTHLPTTLGEEGRFEIISNPIQQPQPQEANQRPGAVTYRYGVEITPPDTDIGSLPATAQAGDAVPASPEIITTENSYETYIPNKYIDSPEDPLGLTCEGDLAGTDWWYTGDNRDVGYNTGKYRTRTVANMPWQPGATQTSKDVHPTNRYERLDNGRLVYDSTRQADSDGIDVRALSNDGNYTRNVIEHEAGNPFCNPLATISYDSQQDIYQDGGHWIYGQHDKMPNHQLYRVDFVQQNPNDPDSPITERRDLVFNHELSDPNCLVQPWPGCGSWRYQYVR
ncbi:hypothetical protein GCM10027174_10300 [Salinifilum aidingensis]